MNTVWLAVTVIAGIFEGLTAGLISLWFVIGGVAALIASMLGASVAVQSVIFVLFSIISMAALRPLIKKNLQSGMDDGRTNVDRLIGKVCLVTQEIDYLRNTGEIMIDGQRWSAKTEDREIVKVGVKVEIKGIDGVKLIVFPL